MSKNKPTLAPRKRPKQARSQQMQQDILDACIRVLRRDGIARLTTPRIAEAAGISVGSLYQYFPNKEAILYAIHSRTTEIAWIEVQRILDDRGLEARERLRLIARFYFHGETEDVARMGPAALDIDHFVGQDARHQELAQQVATRFTRFVRESLPRKARSGDVEFASRLVVTVIDGVGRNLAQQGLPADVLDEWARAVAKMLADFIGLP